jgi:hypothetical protein
LLLCLGFAVLATPGQAGESTYDLGSEVYYYQYREPLFAKLVGESFGFTGDYTYKFGEFLFAQANARVDLGKLDYSSDGTGSVDGIDDNTEEGRGLIGAGTLLAKDFYGSFYTGFGYRRLYDDKGPGLTDEGASGYSRQSQYFYIPFGASFTFPVLGGSAMSLSGEADYLVRGFQDSYLRDLGADNNVHNTQTKGYGLRGGINFVPESLPFLSFGAFVRYWNIEDSDVQPINVGGQVFEYGQEPGNNTLETGLQAKIRF